LSHIINALCQIFQHNDEFFVQRKKLEKILNDELGNISDSDSDSDNSKNGKSLKKSKSLVPEVKSKNYSVKEKSKNASVKEKSKNSISDETSENAETKEKANVNSASSSKSDISSKIDTSSSNHQNTTSTEFDIRHPDTVQNSSKSKTCFIL
jgi:hypothetical protein